MTMVNRAGLILSVCMVICMMFMCLFVNKDASYADVENIGDEGAISANAENAEPLFLEEKIQFDDSIWGRLASLIQDMMEA